MLFTLSGNLGGLGEDPPPEPAPEPPPDPPAPAPAPHPHWWADYGGRRPWWPSGVVYRVVETGSGGGPTWAMVALGASLLAILLSTRK